ncbi:acyltransferase [Flavobacterium acetivorans]|uniref:acyltransferase n=1 Tax=Flavobacterium acetivorans TaxID=2893883 RepID=UPI001E4E9526|nr:acyltransferase [Flavobacterium sp. F-29]UFH35769.1 acyltransferase [Flavobacterium sp. F-29]
MKVIIRKANSLIKTFLLYKIFRYWVILNFISPKLRSVILRFCGAKVGKGVYFSNGIYIDNNAEHLEVGNDVLFSPNITILFHKRNMKEYEKGKLIKTVSHQKSKVIIGDGASIGTNVLILPGVKIGEGAVIGAGTVVSKDVPAWHLAVGNPMKVIKEY